jgi:hypothetical protein
VGLAVPIALFALAALGVAGLILLPMRIWSIVVWRRIGSNELESTSGYIMSAVVIVVIAVALWIGVWLMPSVFLCLISGECTGDRARGVLISLALLGVAVGFVELAWRIGQIVLTRRASAT